MEKKLEKNHHHVILTPKKKKEKKKAIMPFPALMITTNAAIPPPPLFLTTTTTTTNLRFSPPPRNPNRNRNPRRLIWPTKCCLEQVASSKGREDAEISRATLIWRAAKLPVYSVALVPLTVGFCAAYLQTGLFFAKRYFALLVASVLIITWLNLSNDVYDFDTGADRDKKESVVNIVGSRKVTQIAANASLVLGFIGLISVFTEAGDIRFILLVTCAILCGYIYQILYLIRIKRTSQSSHFTTIQLMVWRQRSRILCCPPFRLSYQGLGEPLCFAAFGPYATAAFYFANSSPNIPKLPLTPTIVTASVLVGITTTLILFCSHFHQIDGDRDVGKISPLVRLGTETGSKLVKFGIVMLYLLLFSFSLYKFLPPACAVLSALTLPIGKLVVDFVEENRNDKVKIFMAKYYCVRLHALFGTALAIGLTLARNETKGMFPLFFSSFL